MIFSMKMATVDTQYAVLVVSRIKSKSGGAVMYYLLHSKAVGVARRDTESQEPLLQLQDRVICI